MTGLHKTTANVFGESAEPSPQVKVGRMDEAKLGHSSQTPELQDQVHSGWNIRGTATEREMGDEQDRA